MSKLNIWYGILLDPDTEKRRTFFGEDEGIASLILFTDPDIARSFSKENFRDAFQGEETNIPSIIRFRIHSELESFHEYSNIGVGSIVFNVNIENCAFRINNKQILQMYGWHHQNDPRFIDH